MLREAGYTSDCLHGARAFTETWRKHHKGEPFRFFVDKGALADFLSERGLDLVEHLDAGEMESAYDTGDAKAPTGTVTGFFCLAVARPTAK